MMDPWSWPNGIIPNSVAGVTTGLVMLICCYRSRHQLRRWLTLGVRASTERTQGPVGRLLQLTLKSLVLVFAGAFIACLVFTMTLLGMVPFYMAEVLLNPKH